MKTLYQASNGVEAHMILHMLQQEGIAGRVDGEYLQGGIGELPAAGLVRVMVPEQDYARARALVEQWDAAQPAQAPAAPQRESRGRAGMLLVGLVIGIACTYAFYRSPVTVDGVDYDGNGKLDETWTYAPSGLPLRNELDRNRDGKVDYITNFGRNGTIVSSVADDNFDGVFEQRSRYRFGNPTVTETDTDGDGYYDLRTNFVDGVHVSTEYINPGNGLSQRTEYFRLGKQTHADTDLDKDGIMDRRTRFDALGEPVSTEELR